ncbi:2'-5' RNA ligase family protein [Streptomyces sp. NPDC050485]|uniref:2'-5' RNA ligase family protein n=1 Tax=Streptomyces sp. NPDC050485 TaxID=3365617 RepID=UPI00379A8C05
MFPPTPPPSTTDGARIAAYEWAEFSRIREMTNHWDRPGWAPATRAYYWMLTVPETVPLVDLAVKCQHHLGPLRFDSIPADGLHLTLGRIGLASAVDRHQLRALAGAAADRLPAAFTLQAIPMTASRGAIRFSLAPWDPVVSLHATLAQASTDNGLALNSATASLRPHIGIAYCPIATDAQLVRETIAPLRSLEPVDLAVDQVHLVELRRENRAYRWDVIHSLPLG